MWGGNNGFQNALAMGMQMGAQARQAQEQRDYRNALAQFDPSNPETLKPIMAVRPEVGIQLQGRIEQRQAAEAAARQEATVADLSNRYLGGDAAAGDELARLNFDRWSKIDTAVKAKATQEANLFGSAALDVLQVPPGPQRRDRIITYAQQFPQLADQINEIAFLPPAEQETRLRAVVAQAGLIQKLHEMEKPQTLNVQPGAGVYERDPRTNEIRTIVQPNYGGAPAFSPAPQGGGQPIAKTVGGVTYYQNPQTGQWFDNPQEAMGAR